MTPEQMKQMAWTGKFTIPRPVTFSTLPPQVAPTPADGMAHVEQPLPPKPTDFNNLSLSEMEHFNQYKGMDPLHQQDAIAKEHNRGRKCREYLEKNGASAFKSNYFKS